MHVIEKPRHAGQEHRPAPIPADTAAQAMPGVNNSVLTSDMCARLVLVNGALRALRKLGIVALALDLHPLDDGQSRIDLGVISRQQADRVLGVADASTRDTARQLYSASAYGVRLVWGIPR